MEKEYIGIVDDVRPPVEREKDWQKVELVGAAPKPLLWLEKTAPDGVQMEFKERTWRHFPDRDQDGSSSCTMQTAAKICGIANYIEEGEYVELSSTFGYSFRANKKWEGSLGMMEYDVVTVLQDYGLCLESQVPSQRLSESEMDAYKPKLSHVQVGKIFKVKNSVKLCVNGFDIDEVASAIATGKGVMLWVKAAKAEYGDVPFVSAATRLDISHSVTGVDYVLWKGEKAIVIDDSWGVFGQFKGQRVFTESFLKARCFMAREFVDVRNDWRDEVKQDQRGEKPMHRFDRDLAFSTVYNVDEDVKALQRILRYEGFFPTHLDGKPLEVTGYYGAVTAKAVLQWQQAHKVASPLELENLLGRKVGPKTRQALNEIYS